MPKVNVYFLTILHPTPQDLKDLNYALPPAIQSHLANAFSHLTHVQLL
jgi:hypothetical protein